MTLSLRILCYVGKHPCCFKTEVSRALEVPLTTIHTRIDTLIRDGKLIQIKIGKNSYICLYEDRAKLDSFSKVKIIESNHGRRAKFRTLEDGTEEKWCNGCEQFVPVERFGLLKKGHRGFQHRCLSCMNKKSKAQYERSKALGRSRKTLSMHIKKPLFKKLKMHPPEGTVRKKCPSCNSIIYVDPDQKEGFCHIHSVKYTISKSLSDSNRSGKAHGIMLKLVKPELFIKDRILDCINEKPRYQHQIAQKFMISSGYTKKIVCELESDGLVSVTRGKNYTWVEAC